jgi:hypothetical protein
MKSLLLAAAAIVVAASPASAFFFRDRPELLTTPPPYPHPLPQGVPYTVDPVQTVGPILLRFAIVDGRRVLFEPTSGRIVYWLTP